jgi:hypothetical protein
MTTRLSKQNLLERLKIQTDTAGVPHEEKCGYPMAQCPWIAFTLESKKDSLPGQTRHQLALI